MSHAAISAVLARHDLPAGERLVAWSLASFANRDQRGWPGIPAAAARAGLSRSRYLELRDRLVRRGLLQIETLGGGRGRASTVKVLFAQFGPWQEDEVNVELLEAVLGYSPTRGPAQLLLAALAALADENGNVEGLTTDELCYAAGLANSTYRRASAARLRRGARRRRPRRPRTNLPLDGTAPGRARRGAGRWTQRRPAPQPRIRPLVAAAASRAETRVENGPIPSGVSAELAIHVTPPIGLDCREKVSGRLTSRDERCVRVRAGGECSLEQPVEEQTAVACAAAVEAKGELVQVVVKLRVADRTLVGAKDPALKQRGHQMHVG